MDCEFKQCNLKTQEIDIAEFDIGIMPLFDTPWSRGKCSYKLLQYMAAGIPFITSAVGMNMDIAHDNDVGYAVINEKDLEDKLILLLANEEIRVSMGRIGPEVIDKKYSIQAVCQTLIKIFYEVA